MAVNLNKPTIGSTGWGQAVNDNWTNIEAAFNFIWQGRFGSCPLDEQHAWHALLYVERNPVRAKLVRVAWSYEWSSAAHHVGLRETDALIRRMPKAAPKAEAWRSYLQEEDETANSESKA